MPSPNSPATESSLLRMRVEQAARGAGGKFNIATVLAEFHHDQRIMKLVLMAINVSGRGAIEIHRQADVFRPSMLAIIGFSDGILNDNAHAIAFLRQSQFARETPTQSRQNITRL
jgi:hypothetical protein